MSHFTEVTRSPLRGGLSPSPAITLCCSRLEQVVRSFIFWRHISRARQQRQTITKYTSNTFSIYAELCHRMWYIGVWRAGTWPVKWGVKGLWGLFVPPTPACCARLTKYISHTFWTIRPDVRSATIHAVSTFIVWHVCPRRCRQICREVTTCLS